MSPSTIEYHLRRAQMERDAAVRATCARSRASHSEMADLHEQQAGICDAGTIAGERVAA